LGPGSRPRKRPPSAGLSSTLHSLVVLKLVISAKVPDSNLPLGFTSLTGLTARFEVRGEQRIAVTMCGVFLDPEQRYLGTAAEVQHTFEACGVGVCARGPHVIVCEG